MSNKEFLNELKEQYNKEFELKNTLETKANYNLVASGVVVTLLFGFGATLLNTSNPVPYLLPIVSIVLAGVILFVVSILFSIFTLRIKQYQYATLHEYFYTEEGCFDEEAKKKYKEMKDDDFFNERVDTYLRSNSSNFTENEYKAKNVKWAHRLFLAGMATVPVAILFFVFGAVL